MELEEGAEAQSSHLNDEDRARLEAFLADTRRWNEAALERCLDEQGGEPRVVDVMRYALLGGGKRLRPALLRMTCTALGGDDRAATAPAVAVELIHTYSLVHDDLPCMDDDDLRRGRPTCHKVYGEALAVLAGDALQTAAFEVLAGEEHGAEQVRVLARASGAAGMVGGQVLDLSLAGGTPTVDAVRAVHLRKTAALIAASAELGAIAAGVLDAQQRADAVAFGRALGLCFQAVDDVLDVTGDAATLGKTPGKDARGDRPTAVAALGLDGARAAAEALAEEARRAGERLGFLDGSLQRLLVDGILERRS